MILDESDVFLGERAKVAAAQKLYRLETITNPDGPLFEQAYALLDEFFGPKGELENKTALRDLVRSRDVWFGEGLFARYFLVAAWSGSEMVGVRDCYIEADPKRRLCFIALSHSLIKPEHRRTGLASLLRSFPVAGGRELVRELFDGAADVPILITAEMEPVEPKNPETVVRLLAYGKSGFAVIDPSYLPYAQPDFRDVEALGLAHWGLPLLPLLRWVGNEAAAAVPAEYAAAFPRHYNSFHMRFTPVERVKPLLANALDTLAGRRADQVPLLRLPVEPSQIHLLEPLLRSNVLRYYPLKLRGANPEIGDPAREFAELRQRWS